MLRKVSIQALVFLLIALPVLGTFAKDSQAAASSRVAIVSDLSGDVQVQKSGGSKKIKAFKKINLNQGDMLLTGSEGSATLQFSNGTSSDDTMTVDANTTLKFSKLTSKNGTVTKVSMLKGTAWSDVKSIKNKDDQFQVETPTAIMGVRGTNFLITVNPFSGTTNTSVFAGIVEVAPPGTILGSGKLPLPAAPGAVISGSTPESVLVYPTNQIIVGSNTAPENLGEQITLMNLESIASNMSASILAAILESKQKIDEENLQLLEQLKGRGLPEQLGSSLDVVGANFENLIGALLNEVISSGSIGLEKIYEIINKAQQFIGQIIEYQNKTLIVSEPEKRKQEILKKQEELRQEQERQKKLLQQQAEAQLLEKLKKEKEKQDQENAAKLEQIKKAIEEQKNPTTPTSPSTPSNPAPSSDAKLSGLTLSDGVLSPAFSPDTASYTVNVSNDVAAIAISPTAASASSVKVNGTSAANGASASVPLSLGSNTITILVTAQDGTTTKTYTLNVNRALITQIGLSFGNGSLAINPDQDEYDLGEFTNEDSSFTLSLPNDGTTYTVSLNGQEVLPGVIRLVALEDPDWTEPLEYHIQLVPGNNAILLTTSLNGYERTYTFNAHLAEEALSDDASLSDIKIGGVSLEGFESHVEKYSLVVPYPTTSLEVEGIAADSGAQVSVEGSSELRVGGNEVTIAVTAADGVAKRTYTITVTREAAASDASLSELAMSDGVALAPGFSPTILEYTAKVNSGVEKISVTPRAAQTSTITVNNGAAQSGLPVPVTLNSSGDTAITIVVTAQNGQKQTYSITVERKSSEASLSKLSVEGYELNPMEGNSYSVRVPASEERLKLSYLLSENASAVVTVNGEATGDDVALDEGENTIRIKVASEDGTNSDEYVIFVERESSDSRLGELSVSGYSLSPGFAPEIVDYAVSVPNSETNVTVNYWLWDELSEAVLKVNNVKVEDPTVALAAGETVIEIVVTSEDGSSSTTYKITVTRNAASSDASLTALTVSEGEFSPTFDPSILDYTVKLDQEVSLLSVTANAASSSKITIKGNPAQSGLSVKVTLSAQGSTTIPIIVTAEDGVTTKEYTITVLRESFSYPTGIIDWSTTLDGEELDSGWVSLGEPETYPGEGYENVYLQYGLYLPSANEQSLWLDFGFDSNVTFRNLDTELGTEYYYDQEANIVSTSFEINEGNNTLWLAYDIKDGDTLVKRITVELLVLVGDRSELSGLSIYAMGGGMSIAYPIDSSTYVSSIADIEQEWILGAEAVMGEVAVYDEQMNELARDEEGYDYVLPLHAGWNTFTIRIFNPVTGTQIGPDNTLDILAGEEEIQAYNLSGITGTDSNGASVGFIAIPEQEYPIWAGTASADTTYVDLLPASQAGTVEKVLYMLNPEVGPIGMQEATKEDGKYRVPLSENEGIAYVLVVVKAGSHFAVNPVVIGREEAEFPALDLSLTYGIGLGQPIYRYENENEISYWSWLLPETSNIHLDASEAGLGYTFSIRKAGEANYVSEAEFDYAPDEGDNVYELKISDEAGHSQFAKLHILLGNMDDPWYVDQLAPSEITLAYGDMLKAFGNSVEYSWYSKSIMIPDGTESAELAFDLPGNASVTLFDSYGLEVSPIDGKYNLSLETESIDGGQSSYYAIVTNYQDGMPDNQVLIPLRINYSSETNESSNVATLSDISIDGATLDNFMPGVFNYDIEVTSDVESIDITALAKESNAQVSGVGNWSLVYGKNKVEILVTAQDGYNERSYVLSIYRQLPGQPGVTAWTTLVNGESAEWNLYNSSIYDTYDYRSYQLYFDEAPSTFEVNFAFDGSVSNATIEAFGETSELNDTFTIPQGLWHTGANDASVSYEVSVGQNTKYVTLFFTVYIGPPEITDLFGWNAYDEEVPIHPVSNNRYTASMGSTGNQTLLLLNPQTTVGGEGEGDSVHISLNGVEVSSEGLFYAYLNDGWNVLDITLDNPVPGGTNGIYQLNVWVGNERPASPGLASVQITDGLGESSEAAPSGAESVQWTGQVSSIDAEYADIAPIAQEGSSIASVSYMNDDWEYALAEAVGEGEYRIPVDYQGYAIAYVTVKDGADHYLTYVLTIKPGKTGNSGGTPGSNGKPEGISVLSATYGESNEATWTGSTEERMYTLLPTGTSLLALYLEPDQSHSVRITDGNGEEVNGDGGQYGLILSEGYNSFTLKVEDSNEVSQYYYLYAIVGDSLPTLSVTYNTETTKQAEYDNGEYRIEVSQLQNGQVDLTWSDDDEGYYEIELRSTFNAIIDPIEEGGVVYALNPIQGISYYYLNVTDRAGRTWQSPIRFRYLPLTPQFDAAVEAYASVDGFEDPQTWKATVLTGQPTYALHLNPDPDVEVTLFDPAMKELTGTNGTYLLDLSGYETGSPIRFVIDLTYRGSGYQFYLDIDYKESF